MFLTPNPVKATCRYALSLKVSSLQQEGGWFGLADHLEQIADWQDSLVIDLQIENQGVDAGNITGGWFGWNSTIDGRIAEPERMPEPLSWQRDDAGVWEGSVPVPATARAMLGAEAHLRFSAVLWD